jgi:glycosyltransferase involved in cell wall biosynthesis
MVGGLIRDSRLINESFDCRYINLGTSSSVEEIGRNPLGKLIRYFKLIWEVKKELISNRPGLCYMTISSKGLGFYKDSLIVLLVRLFGVRRIYHFHNKGVSTRQERFFDNLLYRMVFRNADVILLSKHLYPDIQKYVPQERVHYCPNGIPDGKGLRAQSAGQDEEGTGHRAQGTGQEDIAPSLHRSLSPSQTTEILFLSHLIISKGLLLLIDACAILKDRGVDFHCTIAGGDAEMKITEVASIVAEKGLSFVITVAGPKHGEKKAELMRSADIFVHPSYNDCLPLVLIEAMQYSLPIVSTPEGAIPDVVEDNVTGFLVPQKDEVALADKLEILIRTLSLRNSMGAAGRLKYEREFTLEIFETRLKEILEKIGSELK